MTVIRIMIAALFVGVAGCFSGTKQFWFEQSSAPMPPEGYTVLGPPVTGVYTQKGRYGRIAEFFGTHDLRDSMPPMQKALQDALRKSPDADALIGVTMDYYWETWPFHSSHSHRVSGTPVKFNNHKK